MRSSRMHLCDDCTHTVTIYDHECKRCTHKWESKLEAPHNCPRCKSPYWQNARSARRYDEVYALAVGGTVNVPWPEGFISGAGAHPVHRLIKKLNREGRRLYVKYDASLGAVVTRGKDPVSYRPIVTPMETPSISSEEK